MFSNQISWKEQKTKLFYLTQKEDKSRKYEIEHIASKTFGEELQELSKYVNHIGNLVFLSSKINKAFSKLTADRDKTISGLEDDFYEKIRKDNTRQNYWSDKALIVVDDKKDINISIVGFLDSLDNHDRKSFDEIMKIIKNRDAQMKGVLMEIYSDFLSAS